jgi:hypothetical protein
MSTREVDLFESVAITARRLSTEEFTKPDDDWEPMAFLDTLGEEQTIVMSLGPLMANDTTKDLLAEVLLPTLIKDMKVVRIVTVFSVWRADVRKDEDPYATRPSKHPDRQEAVMLAELTAEGVVRYSFASITRHETSPPTLGEWEELPEADGFSGRFVDPLVKALKEVAA